MIDKYSALTRKTRIKKLLPFLVVDIAYTIFIVHQGYFSAIGTGFFAELPAWSVIAFNTIIIFYLLLGTEGFVIGFFILFSSFFTGLARILVLLSFFAIHHFYMKIYTTKQWKRAIHKYYPHLNKVQLAKVTSMVEPLLKTSNYIVSNSLAYSSLDSMYELFILSQKLLFNHFLIASTGSGKTKQFGFLYVNDETFAFFPFETIAEMEEQAALLLSGDALNSTAIVTAPVTQADGILRPFPERTVLQLQNTDETFPFTVELPYFESDLYSFFSGTGVPAQFQSTHIAKQVPFRIDDVVADALSTI